MKVFQIMDGFCYYDATKLYRNAKEASKYYSSEIMFVDSPDFVFEGWGYDKSKSGDERFIKPTPPNGWLYDEETGTFYPENELPPNQKPTEEERLRADVDFIMVMEGLL